MKISLSPLKCAQGSQMGVKYFLRHEIEVNPSNMRSRKGKENAKWWMHLAPLPSVPNAQDLKCAQGGMHEKKKI